MLRAFSAFLVLFSILSLIVQQLYYVFVKVVLLLFEMIVVIWVKLLLKQFR